jgi:hypothetical protein
MELAPLDPAPDPAVLDPAVLDPAGAVAPASAATWAPMEPRSISARAVEDGTTPVDPPPLGRRPPLGRPPPAVGMLSTYCCTAELPAGSWLRAFATATAGQASATTSSGVSLRTNNIYVAVPRKLTSRTRFAISHQPC